MEENILEVKRLKVSFRTDNGTVKAVRDISFDLKKGHTLAIVGESGSGKSVTSKVILGISAGNAIIEGGEVLYAGKDIVKLTEEEMCNIRGDKISMIFQDPLSSLNPIVRIGDQIIEAMLLKNKEKRRYNKRLFNGNLRTLRQNIIEAYGETDEDVKKQAVALCKEFDKFNIKGIQLENSFVQSLTKVHDVLDMIKDFLFLNEKGRRQNIIAWPKEARKNLNDVNDKYLVRQDDRKTLDELKESLIELVKVCRQSKMGGKALANEQNRKLSLLAESVEKYLNYALENYIPKKTIVS